MVVAAVLSPLAAHAGDESTRQFTVSSSIEATRVVRLSAYDTSDASAIALFSPERTRLAIGTHRGDLTRNVNVESLVFFGSEEVASYLSGRDGTPIPTGSALVQRDIGDNSSGIANIQWINEDEVAFIAPADGGIRQVNLLDVRTGKSLQLTHSATDVVSFGLGGDQIVYYARIPAPPVQVMSIGGKSIFELLRWNTDPTVLPLQMFSLSRSTGQTRRIGFPSFRLDEYFRRIWVSQSGRYAVTFAPAVAVPSHWSDYLVYLPHLAFTASTNIQDPAAGETGYRVRYQVADLQSGVVRPLLDAPSGVLALNNTPAAVFWTAAERSVLVSNTYLPLDELDRDMRDKRRSVPAIAEVDLRSGAVTMVDWEPFKSASERLQGQALEPIIKLDWDNVAGVLRVDKQLRTGEVVHEYHRRVGRSWRRATVSLQRRPKPPELSVELREGLNERPRVYASSIHCECSKMLLDPAPELETFTFGRAEEFEWTDGNGIKGIAGLIFPPNYVATIKYPLVVQTHGFNRGEFLIDGPDGSTAAMAAQPLANAGIIVLQIADNGRTWTNDEREGPLTAEAYRAAVQQLIDRGTVDAERVGIVGFSRTAYHVLHLLAKHPSLFKAATLADGIQLGFMNDLLLANYPAAGTEQMRRMTGGAPKFNSVQDWFDRNPTYRLTQMRSAVRIEGYDPSGLVGMWETYAVLRQASRPVDLVYFPFASHVPTKPAERVATQGGNVDWFRFWLRDYEDPDPAKRDQYESWRRLRAGE